MKFIRAYQSLGLEKSLQLLEKNALSLTQGNLLVEGALI
jgi:hypothetical protein